MFNFHLETASLDKFIRGLPQSAVGLIWSYPQDTNLYHSQEWPILNKYFDRVLDLSTLSFEKQLDFSKLHFLQTERFGEPFFLLLMPVEQKDNSDLNLNSIKKFMKDNLSLLQQLSLNRKDLGLISSFGSSQQDIIAQAIHETFSEIQLLQFKE